MMCAGYMSTARARCPDCRDIIEIPYNWCGAHGGIDDEDLVADILVEHARRMPILHPTLLPEHHLVSVRPV